MKKLIFLFMLSLLLVSMAWGQTTIHSDACASATSGWTFSNGGGLAIQQGGYWLVDNSGDAIISEAFDVSGYVDLTLSFKVATYGSGTANPAQVEYSTDNGSTWNATVFTSATPSSKTYINSGTWNIGTVSSSQFKLKWTRPAATGRGVRIDDILFQGTPDAGSPLIALNPSTLSGFTYSHANGPSTANSFSVTGSSLTGNLSVSSSGTDYVVSATEGGTYGSSLTLTQSGGSVSATVYVKLNAGLAIGVYNNQTITVSGGDATSQTVNCSGEVTTPAAPSAPLATAATVLGSDSFTANWGSVSGATGYYLDVYTKTIGAAATDLFISEYIEGSSINKAIEIYNGTGTTVDLSNYSLLKQTNGAGSFGGKLSLIGNLTDGDVYVVAHSSANATILALADQTFGGSPMDFNGNDCVALYKNDGTNDVQIDVVGVVDQVADWGKDVTLVRKSSVSSPTTTYSTSDWDSYAKDTTTYLGSHTMAGGSSSSYVTGFDNRDVSNVTSYEVTGLDPETEYYYVVRAYDAYSQTSSSSNEIEVTTTAASTYDYPEDTEIDAVVVLIEITGGNGIIVSGTPTPVPNPGFTPTFEQRIELTGDGPWIVTVFSLDQWVACLFDGTWIVEEVDGTGYVYFWLEFAKSKNTVIELKSGNGGNPTLPVELSTFTATISSIHNAVLTWVTETETNVNGFYIYRNMENNLESALMVSNLIPATNTSTQQVYQFTDKELNQTGTYYYWLMVADMDGSEGFHGPISLNYEQGGLQLPEIPKFTELKNVYPNPFNPSTTISYALANSQNVNFNIFNNRGQMVRSMELGNKAAGNHSFVWDGCDNYGRSVSTGVYFIRMQAGSESFSKKAVLMK